MGSEREGGFISMGDGWEGIAWGSFVCVFSRGCVEQVLRIGDGPDGCLSVWLSWLCSWQGHRQRIAATSDAQWRSTQVLSDQNVFLVSRFALQPAAAQRKRVKTRLEHSTCTTSTGARSGDGLQH